jgi:hypothetical protein
MKRWILLLVVFLVLLGAVFGCGKKSEIVRTTSKPSPVNEVRGGTLIPDTSLIVGDNSQNERIKASIACEVGYACGIWLGTFDPAHLMLQTRADAYKIMREHASVIGLKLSPDQATAKNFTDAFRIGNLYSRQLNSHPSLTGKCYILGTSAGIARLCALPGSRLPSAHLMAFEKRANVREFNLLVTSSEVIGLSLQLKQDIVGLYTRVKEADTYQELEGPARDVRPWLTTAAKEIGGQ